jgi:hypothetical protein
MVTVIMVVVVFRVVSVFMVVVVVVVVVVLVLVWYGVRVAVLGIHPLILPCRTVPHTKTPPIPLSYARRVDCDTATVEPCGAGGRPAMAARRRARRRGQPA